MATTNYHVTGQTGVGSSTALPKKGFKLAIPTANGVLVVFDKRFWSVKHLSKDSAGAASNGDVFYRAGASLPTASYAVDTAAKKASLVIPDGGDELMQIDNGTKATEYNAVCFLAVGAEVVLQFRPNSAEYK